jgi:CRP-like cAMP-binding protein
MRTKVSARRLRLLRQVPAFRRSSDRVLARIDSLMDEVTVEAGQVLIREGEPARQSFIVLWGRAGVSLRGEPLAVLGPGSFVGEMAMLDLGPRAATVTALSPMRLLVIGPAAFATLMEMPGVALPVVREMAGRLREVVAARYAA